LVALLAGASFYMVDYAFGLAVRVYDAYGITMFELTNYT
jgi:hypothetical protein